MLLAEDVLLLVTDEASGRLSAPAAQVDAVLGGANLVELTLMSKVAVSGERDQGKPGRLIVRDLSPAGDEVLDAALGIVSAHQGRQPSTVIRPLGQEPARHAVSAAGCQRGDPRRAGPGLRDLPHPQVASQCRCLCGAKYRFAAR